MNQDQRELRLRVFDGFVSTIAFAAIGFMLGTMFPRQVGMILFWFISICDFG
jgi:hypothetical protein